MKLSVIIPVYNGGEFIDKSYNSIIDQDVNDFEILYVDNNSSDDTVKNINKVTQKDARVKLLTQKKQGAAAARNMGITHAQGEYVYVFDVDDEIYPNALNTMIAVLDEHPKIKAVFGKMVKSDKSIPETTKPKDASGKVILKDKPYWGLLWFSDLKTVVGPPAFLYRKSVFSVIGLYNEAIKNNEDTALDVKLGMTSDIAFLDMYVYLYFKHAESTIEQSKRQMPRPFMIWPRLIKEHLPFYLENKNETEFKKILFKQLYHGIGKQIFLTKGLKERIKLKQKLTTEILPLKLPFAIKTCISILVVFPYSYFIKFYGYYLVPYFINKIV